jgi:hypothetical protein
MSKVANVKSDKMTADDRAECLPPLPIEMVMRCEGGPTAMLQAAVFSNEGSILTGVGFLGFGAPLSTGDTGTIRWPIHTKDVGHAKAARVKWRTIVTAGAADLHPYTLHIEFIDDGQVAWRRTLHRSIPDGQDSEAFEMSVEFC